MRGVHLFLFKKAASTGKQEAVQEKKEKKCALFSSVTGSAAGIFRGHFLKTFETFFFFVFFPSVHPFHVTSGVDGLLTVLRLV